MLTMIWYLDLIFKILYFKRRNLLKTEYNVQVRKIIVLKHMNLQKSFFEKIKKS